jgi:uncharacterized protein
MDNPIQVDLGRIAQDLQIRRLQVESVVSLLDEGNTVPFITRYRKEATGSLKETVIQEIQLRVQRLRDLAERKETILKSIESQGKLIPDLAAAIRAAENPKRLEDLYLPFKPKKRSKASDARDRGLEPLAFRIWTRDETLTDLSAAAGEYVNPEKGVETVESVLEGVGHILAEAISEMAAVRDAVRRVVWKTGKIVTSKADIPEGQGLEYRDYFQYSEPAAQIPPHRILAINRGDKEGPLKVRLDLPRPEVEAVVFAQLPLEGHPHADLFRSAALDALDRLILPSMEREVRRDLTEAAERHAVEVFAKNLRSLLLQPPISKQVVLAIDPGFRTGCKLAVLDQTGELLNHAVIYPHPPQNRRSEAKLTLKELVGKHRVGVVAIGNGTACRETEELIAEIIAEGIKFSQGAAPADIADAEASSTAPPAAEAALTIPAAAADRAGAEGPPAASDSIEPPTPSSTADDPGQTQRSDESASGVPPAHAHDNGRIPSPETEQVVASVSDPPSASETHLAAPAEAPLEALPPISGGAPDSAPPEAEIETREHQSPPADSGSAVALGDADERPHGEPAMQAALPEAGALPIAGADHDPGAGPSPPETTSASQSTPVPACEQAVTPATEQPEAAAPPTAPAAGEVAPATGDAGPPAGEAAAPITEAAPAATEAAPTAQPPTPPLRTAKSGGHGRSESSRSRPPRTKHAPPPPQEPPKPHRADALLAQLAYVVVNEAGASVYSTSQIGRDELPDSDATLRSGISIGRRLQDPLAELVKIEPQNIGVGLYQHDVNPKNLKDTLESVISSCVNFVGVDLNTASVPLLRHVSGLNQLTARRIVDYRKEHGPFTTREQLLKVEGIGPATYTQAAGFLKIREGESPLDRTWIHPESYPVAFKLLEKLECPPEALGDGARLPELRTKLSQLALSGLARELEVGEPTLRDIVEALGRPERDPREDLPKPIFKKGVLKIEDLTAGMELKGTVLNVVDFGAFVDIGLKDSGLVHISQLANRYIKTPHDVVSVGDVVTVWVMGVDQERKRVSLTMVKPGTERQRGSQSGSRRGGEPRERGPGQGRRGGGDRPPRPSVSALTSPPVGAPSVAVLADSPPRRADRDRGAAGHGPGAPRSAEPRGQSSAPDSGSPRTGGAPPRHGPGPGAPPGRGGPRGPHTGSIHGPGRGRPEHGSTGRPPGRPPRVTPPPPPLSKDALAGNVPLRTFGQLKQLWEARVEGPPDAAGASAEPVPQATDHSPTALDQPQDQSGPPQAPTTSPPETNPETPPAPAHTTEPQTTVNSA